MIRTGREASVSRVRPPKDAENIPHSAATKGGTPARTPAMAPMQQKAEIPMVSHLEGRDVSS